MEFTITEHVSPCSFIRQYPHGAKSDESVLHLAVKEYRPKTAQADDEDAVTIIAAHGVGFPKETYEPLWEKLVKAASGFKVASIWIADVANHGASYDLNQEELGDDPNYKDHSLDLLLMINRFRHRMKTPLIGVGHSMGGAQIAYLAALHPRLLHSVVLLDPVLLSFHPPGPSAALFSSLRREKWDSRAKAEAQIGKNPFFADMDPQALKLFLVHALRDTPDGGANLSTPKAQEAWSYVRSMFHDMSEDTLEGRQHERMLNPDALPFSPASKALTMRGEMLPICESLQNMTPRALFVYAEYSHINHDEIREYHLASTGTGRGGNGGVSEGGVKVEMLEDCGHLCPFENPGIVARVVSKWLKTEMVRWNKEKTFWSTVDTGKSKNGGKELSEKWLAAVKLDTTVQRPGAEKAKL